MTLWPRLASLLLLLPLLAPAQPAVVNTEHVRAELVAHAPEGIAPGKDVRLGLALTHQPHWHTYWKNPGDSGLPTKLAWQLPEGVRAGEIEWPTPRPLPLGPLMNHGYEGELLLPVTLTLPAGFAADTLDVKLHAEWLVCKDICIPESGDFSLRLPAAAPTSGHAAQFATARERLPRTLEALTASARVEGAVLALQVDGLPPAAQRKRLTFFPETGAVLEPAAPVEQRWEASRWIARLPLAEQRDASPSAMLAVLAIAGESTGWRIRVPITGPWPAAGTVAAAPTAAPASSAPVSSLALSLGLALLGGLLLNLMPCVFPVLSLKVLGFAHGHGDRRALAAGGLAYTLGVVLSFIALAGLLLALRAGGEQLGWGFQLQSPPFVAALAVAVASPCTAPFMGVALG
ncbi:MAG TPA: protein-disulfide reductase DsbD domain-containing protein, partial [Rhizobacter sp.]|nr:protein-disulfide reductase DsbD domain-containing protein [Rhizobacter sp.]